MLPPPPLSPTDTLVDGKTPQRISPARRYMLLIVFCLAQFLDACNNASLFSAIPSLIIALGITESESTWVISAFQLTFASFLLVVSVQIWAPTYLCSSCISHSQSGRISDVYNPSMLFLRCTSPSKWLTVTVSCRRSGLHNRTWAIGTSVNCRRFLRK